MARTSEVAIVGGGAAGCAAAYYLARAGAQVTVLEREGIASQASGFSAGGLNPLQGTGIPGLLGPLAMESFRMHLEMWDHLKSESGIDFQPRIVSVVGVAFGESELPEHKETLDIFEATEGFSARWMDSHDLRAAEPRIAHDAICGLYTLGNAALDSYLYTVALSKAAQKRGAAVLPGNVTGLTKANGRVTAVVLKDEEIACDTLVLAMGPWTRNAEQWLGIDIPIEPLKGEILRMKLPGPRLSHDFSWGHVALHDRADGLVWVGATEEHRGFDTEPSDSALQALLQGASRLMPNMAEASLVKHTACLRPVTSDWLPIIGRAPGWDNVYLSTGAGKKGILLSPAIGKAIADLITEGETQLPTGPFAPERFGQASG
jgi:glycine oxidase